MVRARPATDEVVSVSTIKRVHLAHFICQDSQSPSLRNVHSHSRAAQNAQTFHVLTPIRRIGLSHAHWCDCRDADTRGRSFCLHFAMSHDCPTDCPYTGVYYVSLHLITRMPDPSSCPPSEDPEIALGHERNGVHRGTSRSANALNSFRSHDVRF